MLSTSCAAAPAERQTVLWSIADRRQDCSVEQGDCEGKHTLCCMIASSCSVRLLDSSCWNRSSVLQGVQMLVISSQVRRAGSATCFDSSLLVSANGLVAFVKHPRQPHLLAWFCVFFAAVHWVMKRKGSTNPYKKAGAVFNDQAWSQRHVQLRWLLRRRATA